jgi:hypothetical protein
VGRGRKSGEWIIQTILNGHRAKKKVIHTSIQMGLIAKRENRATIKALKKLCSVGTPKLPGLE